jgi:hypothetical protein
VRIPIGGLEGKSVRLRDLIGPGIYQRDGTELVESGLYVDLPPWGYNVFELES